uniref:Uncharacterized protein n=1 Tax=Anopheles atroparvus TaxID=41427 RepID=A0A182INI9_ANOAO
MAWSRVRLRVSSFFLRRLCMVRKRPVQACRRRGNSPRSSASSDSKRGRSFSEIRRRFEAPRAPLILLLLLLLALLRRSSSSGSCISISPVGVAVVIVTCVVPAATGVTAGKLDGMATKWEVNLWLADQQNAPKGFSQECFATFDPSRLARG